MSMYTQLLEAAFRERPSVDVDPSPDGALEQALRRKRDLRERLPAVEGDDMVPAHLALQIGYDVALLELAGQVGIETEPSRFEQPQCERERLEGALRERGIDLEGAPDAQEAASNHN